MYLGSTNRAAKTLPPQPEPLANCPWSRVPRRVSRAVLRDRGASAPAPSTERAPQFWRHRSLPERILRVDCSYLYHRPASDPERCWHIAVRQEELGTVFQRICTRAFLSPKEKPYNGLSKEQNCFLRRGRMLLRASEY